MAAVGSCGRGQLAGFRWLALGGEVHLARRKIVLPLYRSGNLTLLVLPACDRIDHKGIQRKRIVGLLDLRRVNCTHTLGFNPSR
jgi:hypothetical protein